MKKLKIYAPLILLILFELVVGILLLINPEGFTQTVINVFGIVLLVIGAVYLIRFFTDKKKEGKYNIATIVLSVISLAVGILCAFFAPTVMGFFTVIAVIYGVILIVSGIFKAKTFFDSRKAKLPVSFLSLVSAIVSIILGVLIVANPFTTTKVLWIFAGISLIVEAVLDAAALVIGIGSKKEQ